MFIKHFLCFKLGKWVFPFQVFKDANVFVNSVISNVLAVSLPIDIISRLVSLSSVIVDLCNVLINLNSLKLRSTVLRIAVIGKFSLTQAPFPLASAEIFPGKATSTFCLYSKPRLVQIRFDRRFYPVWATIWINRRWFFLTWRHPSTELSVKITYIEHIYHPRANFRRSKMNLVMHLQWHNKLVTAISTQLWKILSFLILDYLVAKKSGILDWRRDFCDCFIALTKTCHRVQYTRIILLCTRTLNTDQ